MARTITTYGSAEIGPGYTISGLTETIAMLDSLPRLVVITGFSEALHAAGTIMEAAVEERTPIRLEELPSGALSVAGGDLKADVYHDVVIDAQYRGGYAFVSFHRYSNVANWLEWGHRMVGHKPGKKQLQGPKTPTGFVRPYPFLRPAFEVSAGPAIDAFVLKLAEVVNRFNNLSTAA